MPRRSRCLAALALALIAGDTFAAKSTLPTLAPLPAGSAAIDPHAGTTNFTFVFAGDNRPAAASCSQPPQLGAIVSAIKANPPAFVLWGGDIVYGKDVDRAAGEYPDFIATVQGAGVPVVTVPGNHELSVKGTKECPVPGKKHKEKKIDEPDPSGKLAAAYTAAIGAPYGVFRYGNAAFIGLDTDDSLNGEYDPGDCGYNGYVGKAQVAALDGTLDALDADAGIAHVFVFMHRPLHGRGAKADDELGPDSVAAIHDLDELIDWKDAKHWKHPKLSLVLASHEHRFFAGAGGKPDDSGKAGEGGTLTRRDPSATGPNYLVSGGAGAPLAKGGHFHFLRIAVDGSEVSVSYVPVDDSASNCPSTK